MRFQLLIAAACAVASLHGAETTLVGRQFPAVTGTALDKKVWNLPADLKGKPTVFLIGLTQNSQFDVDRWVLGLMQLKTPVFVMELPVIKGMIPRMISGAINQGMREGVPEADWGGVVTVYKDAAKITSLVGTEQHDHARIVLLDGAGTIQWFSKAGYSARGVTELDGAVRQLPK